MILAGVVRARNTKNATTQINMISFVYFDVGGTVIKDFSGTDKLEHEPEISCGRYPIEPSLVSEFVNRFEKNESIWPVINELKKHCRVGLLTNMYPGMLALIKQKGLLPRIDWEIIVDSSEVGFCKPNKEIYEIARQKTGVPAEEILFIAIGSHSSLYG